MATILVVDDDRVIRDLLTMILKTKNYDVLEFEDARPALDEVDFSETDLIITDFQMPTPGDEFVRELKDRGIEVPVMVLSAALDQDEVAVLESLGVQTIMKKPFTIVELLQAVEELVQED
jgi:DNA-binding response OmpR family regulator